MRRSLRWLWDEIDVVRGWLAAFAVAMIVWVFVRPALGVVAGVVLAGALVLLPSYLGNRQERRREPN